MSLSRCVDQRHHPANQRRGMHIVVVGTRSDRPLHVEQEPQHAPNWEHLDGKRCPEANPQAIFGDRLGVFAFGVTDVIEAGRHWIEFDVRWQVAASRPARSRPMGVAKSASRRSATRRRRHVERSASEPLSNTAASAGRSAHCWPIGALTDIESENRTMVRRTEPRRSRCTSTPPMTRSLESRFFRV